MVEMTVLTPAIAMMAAVGRRRSFASRDALIIFRTGEVYLDERSGSGYHACYLSIERIVIASSIWT